MKLFRFCSFEEVRRAMRGDTMLNKTDHHKDNMRRSKSVGFCWFDEDTLSVYDAAMILTGVATTEFVIMVEVDDPEKAGFKPSEGVYYDHRWEKGKTDKEIEEAVRKEFVDMAMGRKVDRGITLKEWCCQSYCLDDIGNYEIRTVDIPSITLNGGDPFEVITSKAWKDGGYGLIKREKGMPKRTCVPTSGFPSSGEMIAKVMILAHLTYETYRNLSDNMTQDCLAMFERDVKAGVDKEVKEAIARGRATAKKGKKNGGKKK